MGISSPIPETVRPPPLRHGEYRKLAPLIFQRVLVGGILLPISDAWPWEKEVECKGLLPLREEWPAAAMMMTTTKEIRGSSSPESFGGCLSTGAVVVVVVVEVSVGVVVASRSAR